MKINTNSFFTKILCALIFVNYSYESEPIDHPGHGKKFGSIGPFLELDQVEDLPTKSFFDNYVKSKKAVVIRKSIIDFPAFKLWTDEYLLDIAKHHDAYKLVIETEKKESREQNILNLSLREFLEVYRTKPLYMVNEVPPYLRKDVVLPQPFQCDHAHTVLEETMMWFSSGGTSSVTHTDDYENILCVFSGVKELVLVDYYKYKNLADLIIDEQKGSYSSMDVDSVDYELFPGIENLEYYKVNLTAGDCLYIPYRWIHQVRSYDRNLAINFWFNFERIFGNVNFSDECSKNKLDLSKTLDKYEYSPIRNDFFLTFKHYIMRQVNLGNRKLADWISFIIGDRKFENEIKEKSEDLLKELFNLIDFNGDGFLSDDEIIDLDENSLEHIAGYLDEIDSLISDKLVEENLENDEEHEEENKADEEQEENHNDDDEPEEEEQEEEQNDNEIKTEL